MSLKNTFKYTLTEDFFMEAALSNIPGVCMQRKFFENPDMATGIVAELWDYGGTEEAYTYTAEAGADYYVYSSSTADTQLVDITIQDEDGYEYIVKVQMAGQTPVKINDLANTFVSSNKRITDYKVTRCYRMENAGTTSFIGTVVVTEGNVAVAGVPTDTKTVRASINNGNNKTLMCQYRIPTGCIGLFYWVFSALVEKKDAIADVGLWTTAPGGIELLQDKIGLNAGGTSALYRSSNIPQVLERRVDITLKGNVSTASGVSGGYIVFLVKEEFANRALEVMEASAHIK